MSVTLFATLLAGCTSISAGPPRLFAVEEETAGIKRNLKDLNLVEFFRLNEDARQKYRNDWVAARMYAIDIHYTGYESALTRERQGVGFGTTVATLGLTGASKLVTPVATKDALTSAAGFVTGARAAYHEDILFAHTMQWVQSQMRSQRTRIALRIFDGLKRSMRDYTMAQAATDLEDYYRAGTFTGGLITTGETVAADAKFSEEAKDERIEVRFRSSDALDALTACINERPGAKAKLQQFVPAPASANVNLLLIGQGPVEDVLAKARRAGICP